MLHSAVVLCYCGKVALLSFGDWIRLLSYGIYEGHVVGEDVEMGPFEEMAKMADGSMDSEELSVEGPVVLFCRRQLATEESDGGRSLWGDLLKGCADGVVTGISQELELGVFRRKGQEDRFADGPLRILEGLLEVLVPLQLPFLSLEGVVKRGEDVGDPWQETMVICHHPDEFLQGFDGLGRWKPLDGVDLVLCGGDTVAGKGVAKEFHLFLGKRALLWVKDEPVVSKALKDDPQVLEVLLDGLGEDENIVNVDDAEGQVP